MRIVIILLALSCAYPVSATDRVASTSGSGSTCSTVSPCSVATAISQAVAGDNVILKDGTYPGGYTINSNAGSSIAPITIKAENQHAADITTATACQAGENDPYAFLVQQQWWIVEGFEISGMCMSIRANAANTEIRYNIIRDYNRFGIHMNASSVNIHHNVIARGFGATVNNDRRGIAIGQNTSGGTIRANWIFSVGNRCFHNGCGSDGMPIEAGGNNDNYLIQGNVMFDGNKSAGVRWFGWTAGGCVTNPTPACPQSTGSTIRDNITSFSGGGAYGITENAASNTITNNFALEVMYGSVVAKGNDPGGNTFTHNTGVRHGVGQSVFSFECGAEVNNVCSKASVVTNNLIYGSLQGDNRLIQTQNYASSIATADYNLIWMSGATSGWTSTYTYGANDIHATGSRPVFVDEAAGDYRLAPGSPGKNAASDGTDMGANFNDDLRVDWLKYLVALPTQENFTPGATSTSFTTTSGRYYQVWGYYDNSSPYTGSETVTVEGVGQTFNMSGAAQWTENEQRYFYLTTRASDGTLNISWTNTGSFDRILIREMPTVTEAWAQLVAEAGGGRLGAAGRLRGRVIQ